MPIFLIVTAVILSVAALLLFSLWGIPFIALFVIVIAAVMLLARRRDPDSIRIERATKGPTGAPSKASGGAETANERVGQG